jgi:DNA-binding NtrC family response regulator
MVVYAGPAQAGTVTRKMLIIDDDTAIHLAYESLFRRYGFEVDGATTRMEADLLLRQNEYDVALVDMRLSGSDDEEGLTIVRELAHRYPALKTVVVTGYSSIALEEAAYKSGASLFFEKPVIPQQMGNAISDLVATN